MPPVTIEEARLMYELGIAEREDGKFGFKLHCGRPGCPELLVDECFCSDDVQTAIRVKQSKRRANYTCGRDCWFLWDSAWDDLSDEVTEWLEWSSTNRDLYNLIVPRILHRAYEGDGEDAQPLAELRPATPDDIARFLRIKTGKTTSDEDGSWAREVMEIPGNWLNLLRTSDRALYDQLIRAYDAHADYDSDGPDGGDGVENCSCEVA